MVTADADRRTRILQDAGFLILSAAEKGLSTAVDVLDAGERGLRILHAYEKVPQHNLENKDSVLRQITEVIREYDEGQSEEWDMPF